MASTARGTATVDGSGVLVAYKPPTPAQRILRDSETRRLENRLWRELELAGLPLPDEYEYHWARAEGRQFRSDGAWPAQRLLVEVEGGIWAREPGRHNRASGFEADCEKYSLAAVLGWRVIRVTEHMISSGLAVSLLRRALQPTERLV